jgi:hypothetical protein
LQASGVGPPHACPPLPTGDHASCDHTATTDNHRSAQPTPPHDRAPSTAKASEHLGARPTYLTDHGAAAEEIGRLQQVLNQVIMLADDAPGLTDEQLRDRLLALADQARPRGQ